MTTELISTVSDKLTEELERLKDKYELRLEPGSLNKLSAINKDDSAYSGTRNAIERGEEIMKLIATISSYDEKVSPYKLQKDLVELRGEMKSTGSGVGFLVKGKGNIDKIIKSLNDAQIEYERRNPVIAAVEKVSDELKKELARLEEDYALSDIAKYTNASPKGRAIARDRKTEIVGLLKLISRYDANTEPSQLQKDLVQLRGNMKSTSSGVGFFVKGKDNIDKIIQIVNKIIPLEPKAKVGIMDKIRKRSR